MNVRRSLIWTTGATLVVALTVPMASGAVAAPGVVASGAVATNVSGASDKLGSDQRLVAGTDLVSPDGRYRLTMRADGSAALLDTAGTALWSTVAAGAGGTLHMRADGKVVLTNAGWAGIWFSPAAASGAELRVLNSGQIAVFASGVAAWWSATGPSAPGAGVLTTGTAPAYPTTSTPAPTASPTATPTTAPVTGTRDAGLQPFSSTSAWNMPIGSGVKFEAATGSRTASLLSGPKAVINRDQWSVTVSQATTSDPSATINGSRNKATFTALVPKSAGPTGGDDRHVTVVQPDRRTAYDIYKWETYSGSTVQTQIVNKVDLAGSGIGIGARAAGVPSVAGLIRAEELRNGHIPHALALAVPGSVLKQGPVWPATRQDADAATSYTGQVPMGALFAIPSSVDVTRLGLSAEGVALARALQDYGAYVVDRAGNNVLYCELSCSSAGHESLRVAWRTLQPQLRAVLNNSATTVGGGGTPRVALAPEVR